jgi:hypothetical protein
MTLPDYRVQYSGSPTWRGPRGAHALEAACSLWFTAEAMLQIFAIPSVSVLLRRTSFAINALAIVPWYSRLMGARDLRLFAILRLLQTMRTLGMIPNSKHLVKLMATTFRRAAYMLALLSCLISMLICVLAFVLWTVERGEWDSDSRMFLQRTGWSCPLTCKGPAWFGVYSGCTAAGDVVWISSPDRIGRQHHLCTPVQVTPKQQLSQVRIVIGLERCAMVGSSMLCAAGRKSFQQLDGLCMVLHGGDRDSGIW